MVVTASLVFVALIICQTLVPICCQNYESGPWANGEENVETLISQPDSNHDEVLPQGWTYSTPSTPRPEDVNCYVEVPTTVTVGGTCVRYGARGTVWLCQSGVNAQVSMECSIRAQNQQRGRSRRRRLRRRSP